MNTLTTTQAATTAHVTVATIRTWCQRGIIAATKQAGRWIINADSLTRRITIGHQQIKARLDRVPAERFWVNSHYIPRHFRACGHIKRTITTDLTASRSVDALCNTCKDAQEKAEEAANPRSAGPRPSKAQLTYLNSLIRQARANGTLPSNTPSKPERLNRHEASEWIDTLKPISRRRAAAGYSRCECASGRYGGVCTCC
ncbi:helix-turn-helix domain-containing protein [Streptomyces albidoflavus]